MAVEKIDISTFLQLAASGLLIDVRSPAEFKHAHIPGAFSLPLFSDEERKIVGTTYKQQSRENAIKTGLDFFGPRMRTMVETVEDLLHSQSPASSPLKKGPVLVHCWRGGMRSAAIAWLLDLYGFNVFQLEGGYKQFRNLVLATLSHTRRFNVLGGYTGSAKSYVLKELSKNGRIVIDLEKLASHRGSAFGGIGEQAQPSQEMFENSLAIELGRIDTKIVLNNTSAESESNNSNTIWIEDESQRIGSLNIPQTLWVNMRSSPVYFLDIPFEQRLDHIVKEYGNLDTEKMLNAILRIKKRLGGLETKTAVNYLIEGNIRESFSVLLKYYDKLYLKGLNTREDLESILTTIKSDSLNASSNCRKVLNAANTNKLIENE